MSSPRVLTVRDGFIVDLIAREVLIEGEPVALTTKEFDLLAFLAAHPRTAFTRAELLRRVWPGAELPDSATVTEHVRRLRQKLGMNPRMTSTIRTIRSIGYRFDP